jgi:hypothetical protein
MSADHPESAAPAAPPPIAAPASKARDPFDPLGWEVPAVCKDCNKQFNVPYRHFHAGVVFHCPHCHGSYVPTLPMYRQIHEAFENFYTRMKHERAEILGSSGDEHAFDSKFDDARAAFQKDLERLAQAMRPAGKMVRRKGLAAMFT